MLVKLILRNVRRSARDYLIYLVTMTLCVALFYGFLSISSSYYQPDLGTEFDLTLLSDGMKLAICVVTLLILFLIRYVNSYMIRRRQREFAIQTILGMEQGTTAKMFFAETLLMGLLSIGTGILLGMAGSQFVTAMLLTSFGKQFRLSWMLFPDTVLLTAGFFGGSFLAVGLFNIHNIRRIRIIDMLNAEKRNEKDLRKSKWMPVITCLYGILLVFMLETGIVKMYYYFDSRLAAPVIIMFLGNILIPGAFLLWLLVWLLKRRRHFHTLLYGWLVCCVLAACFAAAVPALTLRYALPLGAGTVNLYLMFLLADMIFFVCTGIYLLSDLIRSIKEKSPENRYHGENLFFYGQILSKLRSTTKTMTLICLTLVFSVCLFMAAPALVGWASGYLDARSVYDVQISTRYNDVYEEASLPRGEYGLVTDFLEEQGIETAYDLTFSLYLPQAEEFHNRYKYDFPVLAISLSDYNQLLEMVGHEPIVLKEGEFATQWKSVAAGEEIREFLDSRDVLETDHGTLQLAQQAWYDYDLGETIYNSYTDVVYVVPDEFCENLLEVNRNRYIITTKPISFEKSAELQRLFAGFYPEEGEGVHYYIRTSTQQINSTKASNFVLQTSMTYGAIVLLVICFTILSLQQLSDAAQYQYRFGVLRKLGVEEPHINRLILRQLAVWFGMPVLLASLVSGVLTGYFFRMISVEISAYIGTGNLLAQVGGIAAVLLALLFCYFVSTWILLRRAVSG